MKQIILLLIVLIQYISALKCPGVCTSNIAGCKAKGGKIAGYCTKEKACCDMSAKKVGSCGDKKIGLKSSIFQSPNYPDASSGDLVCNFEFILDPTYLGLSIEFLHVKMAGLGLREHSSCESDMIIFKGFRFWQPPPKCGNLTGYVALIDKNPQTGEMKSLKVVAIMTSSLWYWKIKITQILPPEKVESTTPLPEEDETPTLNITQLGETFECNDPSEYSNTPNVGEKVIQNRYERIEQNYNLVDSSEEDNLGMNIIEPLVVNGKDTKISKVPWQASLRSVYPAHILKLNNLTEAFNRQMGENCTDVGRHFCGGSIISDQHILSASHCFSAIDKLHNWQKINGFKVILGDTNLCLNDGDEYGRPSQSYEVEKVIFHYGYDNQLIMNDVAVIKLKKKIQFNEYIKPIKLAPINKKYYGERVMVSGWGLTNLTISSAKIPEILQYTDELYVGNKTFCHSHCIRMFRAPEGYVNHFPKYFKVFDSILCTDYMKNSTFKLVGQGDSGGPLIWVIKEPIQIGVVSFGLESLPVKMEHDNRFVDFFQDVSYYRKWIDLAMMA